MRKLSNIVKTLIGVFAGVVVIGALPRADHFLIRNSSGLRPLLV